MKKMLQIVNGAAERVQNLPLFQKRIFIPSRVLLAASLGYICLPLLIFAFGWMKIWIALLFSAACIFDCIGMVKSFSKKGEGISIGLFALCLGGALLLIYGAVCGWGDTSRRRGIGQNTTPSCAI